MTASAVGADVESLCAKCGDVWHVVVAKVGDQIVKVQCKQCGAYHRHRAPGGGTQRKPRGVSTRAAGQRGGSAMGRVEARAVADTFKADPSQPVRPYGMRESFRVGEQIAHPRFGVGLVERVSEPGKISVLFADGRRVLAQAKPTSTLDTADHMGPRRVE